MKRKKALSLKFYQNINEMPLMNFALCLIERDFKYIYKTETKKQNIIYETEHFSTLLQEFNKSFNNGNERIYDDIIKYNILITKIRVLESCLAFLFGDFSDEIKKVLKGYGIKIIGDAQKDFMTIEGKKNSFIREFNKIKEQLEEKENESKLMLSLDFFENALSAIRIHYNTFIDMRTITVAAFCSYYNALKIEVEKHKKINHGRGKN
jgi:hypothetical protein